MRIFAGIFFILHGLVHLIYYGHSRRFFELKPGLKWPDGAWFASNLAGEGVVRWIAGIACIIAAITFASGGILLFAKMAAWRPLILFAAVFSSLFYLLFWNGKMQDIDGQGAIGILINLLIIALVILRVPFLQVR